MIKLLETMKAGVREVGTYVGEKTERYLIFECVNKGVPTQVIYTEDFSTVWMTEGMITTKYESKTEFLGSTKVRPKGKNPIARYLVFGDPLNAKYITDAQRRMPEMAIGVQHTINAWKKRHA